MPSGRGKRKLLHSQIYNDTLKNGGYCILLSKLATSPVCSLKLCLYFKCSIFHRSEKEGNTNRTGDERREEHEKENKKNEERRNRIMNFFLPRYVF